jgi:N-acetylneuraminic acid mutarotase
LDVHDKKMDTVVMCSEGKWTRVAPLQTARSFFALCEAGGFLFAVGGTGADGGVLRSIEKYTPATDLWSFVAQMPTARGGVAVCVLGGCIYAFGGAVGAGVYLDEALKYDPVADSWTTLAPMPTERCYPVACVVDDCIVVAGGKNSVEEDGEMVQKQLDIVEKYDPATQAWSTLAPMKETRHNAGGCVFNGRMHVAGGVGRPGGPRGTVERYDAAANAWSTLPSSMQSKRYGHGACVITVQRDVLQQRTLDLQRERQRRQQAAAGGQ